MNALTANPTVTMSSLDMVEFINKSREEGEAALAHADFLKKVPHVLGEEPRKNFLGQYKAGNGQMQPCYNFPKREACLMAMSYSYELQAKVFDRMTALETKPMSAMEMVIASAQAVLALEQKQAALETKVAMIESKVQAQQEFFTIIGYANTLNPKMKLDTAIASVLGRRASSLSRARDIMIGKTSDPRFGEVQTYHESVLQDVFLEFKGARL